MKNKIKIQYRLFAAFLLAGLLSAPGTFAQGVSFKEMSVGTLQNFYASIGCEVEIVRGGGQQDGWQWPAQYKYQDNQAARGMWFGCKDYTDANGLTFPYRVVHVGPRVSGVSEFFPVKFEMTSRFEPPQVFVDGSPSYQKEVENEKIDPTMKWDRMIENEVNSLIGVTMNRKIFQFTHPNHSNYIIQEMTFTNTGNTDGDAEIELPNQVVKDFMVMFQYRWASTRQTRYVIANGTGWGMNTMLDARGDGYLPDPPGQEYRTQFSWHGYFPDKIVSYDNIGAPIWTAASSVGLVDNYDSVGRLGAPQFIGVLTLHADKSPTDKTNDPAQPSTTTYFSSDDPRTSNNDAFNTGKMTSEYLDWMRAGHTYPRHAYVVQPSGDFTTQTAGPNLGTPGGFSAADGYGPYTLNPGESIRIVIAEGAAGLDRKTCIEVGQKYKYGQISAQQKNVEFFKGRDSLFKTWKNATDNFNSNWSLGSTGVPLPPKLVEVNSGGDRISLKWETYTEANAAWKYRVYRSTRLNDEFQMIAEVAGNTYEDKDLIRGISYYYFVVAFDPSSGLESSRFYSQSFDPGTLKRPAGKNIKNARVVPNPYVISSDIDLLRFQDERANQLAFFEIPGNCTIKIYTELGELIDEIEHNDGSGDAYWNSTTSSRQFVVSGIYIAVITDNVTGEKQILKFAVIR